LLIIYCFPCLNFYSTLSLGTSWNSLGRLWTGSRLFHRGHAHDGRGPFAHPTLSVVATQCFCPGPEYKTPAWHPVASDQLQPIMTNCFAGWRRPVASWATQGSAQAHNIRDRMGLATHCGQCIRHSRSRGRAIGSWECGRGSPVSPWTIRTVIPQLPPATIRYPAKIPIIPCWMRRAKMFHMLRVWTCLGRQGLVTLDISGPSGPTNVHPHLAGLQTPYSPMLCTSWLHPYISYFHYTLRMANICLKKESVYIYIIIYLYTSLGIFPHIPILISHSILFIPIYPSLSHTQDFFRGTGHAGNHQGIGGGTTS